MIDNTQKKNIFIFDAAEGMVLSQDIMTSTGHLIAAKDTVLTLDMIAKISEYNVLKINVYEEAAAQPEQPEVLEQMTYYEKIKQSQNFEHFNETFIDGINDLKTELNDIVINHETIDTTALLKNTEKILAEYTNTLQIFDMLHCMRDMDDLTYVHCINVAIIASILGKWLGYSEEDVKVLTLCGILHDIGKLLVPNEILSKPDRLTANEYAIIKEHVNLGYQIVKDADIDERVKSAILLHHEKCDGSGYPMGLKSEDIPFHVVRDMEQDAFTKFDPKFSLPFLKNVATSYIGNNVKLSDGRTGEVVLINGHALSRPIVKCEGNEFVDLSKERNLEIVAVLQ